MCLGRLKVTAHELTHGEAELDPRNSMHRLGLLGPGQHPLSFSHGFVGSPHSSQGVEAVADTLEVGHRWTLALQLERKFGVG